MRESIGERRVLDTDESGFARFAYIRSQKRVRMDLASGRMDAEKWDGGGRSCTAQRNED